MTPHDDQPRDVDPAEVIDLAGARARRVDRGGDDGVVADEPDPAPVPGPDDDRTWYPL